MPRIAVMRTLERRHDILGDAARLLRSRLT
jgi:hypothetical protein